MRKNKLIILALLAALLNVALAAGAGTYSWEEKSRRQVISESLDALEGRGGEPIKPRKNLDYFSERSTMEPVEDIGSPKEVEMWLRKDQPFFYEEFKKQEREREFRSDPTNSGLYKLLRSIDYGLVIESKVKPQYYMETVFPLRQSEDLTHTVFSHDRMSSSGGDGLDYSLGLGYRYYDQDQNFIVGANSFFDHQLGEGHYRLGMGGEFINSYGELRMNYYNALSDQKSFGDYFERAVDGFDMELGTQVPGTHIAKIFGGYQWYDYTHSRDIDGWTARLELRPTGFVRLNAKVIQERDQDRIWRLDGSLNFDFTSFDPEDISYDLQGKPVEKRPKDLRHLLLDRVEREFKVRTERWRAPAPPEPPEVGPDRIVHMRVRFPAAFCPPCDDGNGNGVVDPDDGFEIDVIVQNLSTTATLTNLFISNVQLSNTADFQQIPAAGGIPDIGPGQTGTTDISTDLDILVFSSATPGESLFITFDLLESGGTRTYTFGPFVVGSIVHDQEYFE